MTSADAAAAHARADLGVPVGDADRDGLEALDPHAQSPARSMILREEGAGALLRRAGAGSPRGGPCSTIRPSSMKMTRSATSPANRDLVGHDHHRRAPPRRARASRSAPRPPARGRGRRSARRTGSAWAASPARGRWRRAAAARPRAARDSRRPCARGRPWPASRGASSRGLGRRQPLHPARRQRDVVERRQVREQVEALEDEADLGPLGAPSRGPSGSAAARPRSSWPIRRPSIQISPPVGRSRKLTQRSSVVLPEPLGPMIARRLAARHLEVDAAAAPRARRSSSAGRRCGRAGHRGGIEPGQLPRPATFSPSWLRLREAARPARSAPSSPPDGRRRSR